VSKAYIIATEAIKDPSGMAEYAKAAEPAIATWRVLRSPAKALGPQRGAPDSEPVRLVRGWPIVIITHVTYRIATGCMLACITGSWLGLDSCCGQEAAAWRFGPAAAPVCEQGRMRE
jgi:Domain of unknown function (DUF1330)